MRDIYTNMGEVYPDLFPISVRGWMKTTVSGDRNLFRDMDIRYILVDLRSGSKLKTDTRGKDISKGYPDAYTAWCEAVDTNIVIDKRNSAA